jgi:selenocysteine lyase/cysteine desulfurase
LNPPIYGWNNVRCPNYVAQEQIVFRPGSQKFEAGTHNLLGIVGLVESLRLITELGVENIASELARKRAWLVQAIQEKGYTVLHAQGTAENSGSILSFLKLGADMPALHQKLMDAMIFTSLRVDRTGQRYIRLSPHYYNTDEEFRRMVDLL